jgi:lipopolysaccharide export system ATP-binding protein
LGVFSWLRPKRKDDSEPATFEGAWRLDLDPSQQRQPRRAREPHLAMRTAAPRPAAPITRREAPPTIPLPEVLPILEPRELARRAARRSAPRRNAGEGFLVATGLEKSYGGRPVVHDVGVDLARGEVVGLLGPNGAGKTTAFYMMIGLVRADAGKIELDGVDVTAFPMYRRARLGIGYLPQEPSIFRGLSVEDNIRAVLEVIEPDKAKREQELDNLLDEFDIADKRKVPAIVISGGERRRVEIARSIATRPSFMLLDEPFAGIDPIQVNEIKKLVRYLARRGIGVLITDHNVRETLDLVDRAYIVHSGEILMEGTPDEIVDNPDVRHLYLGREFEL